MEIFSLLETYRKNLSDTKELNDQVAKKNSEIAVIDEAATNELAGVEKRELEERNRKLEEFVGDSTSGLSEKLADLKQERVVEMQNYEEDRAALTEAYVSEDYADRQSVVDEVQLAVNNIRSSLKDAIGEKTYEKLVEKIECKSEGMSIDEIYGMIDYFNDSESMVVLLGKVRNPFLLAITQIERVNFGDRELTFKYAMPVFAGVYVLLFILLAKYVFIFVAAALILSFGYGVVSTYFLRKMLVAATAIQVNLDTVMDDLHKQILDDRDARITELDEKHVRSMEESQAEIDAVLKEMQDATGEANGSFAFDNAEFEARKRQIESDRDARASVLRGELADLKSKAVALATERKNVEGKIRERIDHVEEELTAVGSERKLQPMFLLDINKETYALTSFEFPMRSMFCVYDDMDSMYNFISLFCMQLRSKLNPFLFRVTVCDTVRMGGTCLKFVTTKEDVEEERMFRILDSAEGVKTEFDTLKSDLRKKNKKVLATSANLDAYNEFMLSIDSVTEPYEFYFVVNPSNDLYQSDSFIQLVQNGAPVGMYVLAFTSAPKLKEDGSSSVKLVEIFNSHYKLVRGNMKPLVKKTIIESLSRK